jgi:hypothetical protein
VIFEPEGQFFYQINTPYYYGNLIGGPISGEIPQTIIARMQILRSSEVKVLYINLFQEALREANPEFQCFRLWNLLETIARNKNYVGRPKKDWHGNKIKNKEGKDRLIQDQAEELVFELLRETLAAHWGECAFGIGLKQGTLLAQIAIWYRRRNCVVHGGDCLCRNPISPLMNEKKMRELKFNNCRRAREEEEGLVDGYLRALRDVTEKVLAAELT